MNIKAVRCDYPGCQDRVIVGPDCKWGVIVIKDEIYTIATLHLCPTHNKPLELVAANLIP